MTISWNQLPLEMRQAIVKEMSVQSRVNLSMCSKSDNQLVRGTKYGKVYRIGFCGGFDIFFIPDCEKIVERRVSIRATDTQTIQNIISLLGTKSTVDLRLKASENFEEYFNWFRNNFHVKPRIVEIDIDCDCDDCYDESIFDWPFNTKIILNVDLNFYYCRLLYLERFNAYDKIVSIKLTGSACKCESMTDEKLKKMRNAKIVNLCNTAVTINGFHWWLKNWQARKDNNEQYKFDMWYNMVNNEFSFENVTNTLLDVIGKTEKVNENMFIGEYWKIEIKKNGKVEGIIILSEHCLIFDSEKTMEDGYSL